MEAATAAVVEAPVLVGVVEAVDEEPDDVTDEATDEAAVLEDGFVVVVVLPVTVARFGRSAGVVCCACVAIAKRRTARIARRKRVDTEAMIGYMSYALNRFSIRKRLSSSERYERVGDCGL